MVGGKNIIGKEFLRNFAKNCRYSLRTIKNVFLDMNFATLLNYRVLFGFPLVSGESFFSSKVSEIAIFARLGLNLT